MLGTVSKKMDSRLGQWSKNARFGALGQMKVNDRKDNLFFS
jgi:hypothetical protein